MKITENNVMLDGVEYIIEYQDIDSFEELDYSLCKQVYAVCLCDGKMVIGLGGNKKSWGLIGGTIEKGETFVQTLKREIQEESNMEVLAWKPIGYQKIVYDDNGEILFQLRAVCKVRPLGKFISDPDGDVDEIKLINPDDYRKYFDWGETSERIMEVAKMELNNL